MISLESLLLLFLGLGAGTYATIIGAGGGFIVMPVLLILFPDETPAVLTAIALAVAGLNSISGSINYARYRRIDYVTGGLVAISIVPGALIGAWLTQFAVRGSFDAFFGFLLVSLSIYIIRKPTLHPRASRDLATARHLTDRDGNTYVYNVRRGMTAAISFLAGIVASLVGVGGGIILVPIFVRILGFPARIATSTILFSVIFMTGASTVVHFLAGDLTTGGWQLIALIGVGIVFGAQIGSAISQKLRSHRIIQLLALGLVVAGIRLMVQGITTI